MHVDKWIEDLRSGSCMSEADLKVLCVQVSFQPKI